MKNLSIVALAALLATPALARRGESEAARPDRGTAAWFLSEGAEHQLEGLIAQSRLVAADASGLSIVLSSETTADVRVVTAGGDIAETCWMVDETSRGGTVVKKEVLCDANPTDADLPELARGTNAWALVDGLEEAIRAEYRLDAGIAGTLTGGSSALAGTTAVDVTLITADGRTITYSCARSGGSGRANLRCTRR